MSFEKRILMLLNILSLMPKFNVNNYYARNTKTVYYVVQTFWNHKLGLKILRRTTQQTPGQIKPPGNIQYTP